MFLRYAVGLYGVESCFFRGVDTFDKVIFSCQYIYFIHFVALAVLSVGLGLLSFYSPTTLVNLVSKISQAFLRADTLCLG